MWDVALVTVYVNLIHGRDLSEPMLKAEFLVIELEGTQSHYLINLLIYVIFQDKVASGSKKHEIMLAYTEVQEVKRSLNWILF